MASNVDPRSDRSRVFTVCVSMPVPILKSDFDILYSITEDKAALWVKAILVVSVFFFLVLCKNYTCLT